MTTDPFEAVDHGRPAIALDVVIPVYNEGGNILRVLTALQRDLKTPARVLICYDSEEDDTLPVIRDRWSGALPVELVRNQGRGAHDAVMTGLRSGKAPYALVFPADDDYNTHMLDALVAKAENGHDIVCASRFMPGGSMVGCPPLKNVLVRAAAASLHRIAGVPTHDATNGFRLFSRRVIDTIPVTSTHGFTYSLEWLVKAHRLGWPIAEAPAQWFERRHGQSRFKVLRWLPAYLRWYVYAFATTFGRRPASSVLVTRTATPSQNSEVRP
jgi:glycosyltransferase involved in cell wall biosynthesis